MKTAVSIPDPLFQAAERLAERLGMPRSRLYSRALERFVRQARERNVTTLLLGGNGGTPAGGGRTTPMRPDHVLVDGKRIGVADDYKWSRPYGPLQR